MQSSTEFASALALALSQVARDRAAHVAIEAPGRTPLAFAALGEHVEAVGRALRRIGIGAQSRVAIVLPNGPEMATAFLAVATAAVCAPLNPNYKRDEFAFYLEDLRADLLIVARGESEPAREAARTLGVAIVDIEVDAAAPAGLFRFGALQGEIVVKPAAHAGDTALILHTSGTTARPKIVPLSGPNLVASARGIAQHLALGHEDRCLNVMPLFHIHGLIGALLASILGGAAVVCTPGFDEGRFFAWVAAHRPTWYSAVPTIHQAVVALGSAGRMQAPDHRFRFVRSSSAALPPRTLAALEALLDAPVIEAYGMTEATHQMTSNPLPPGQRKPGSVGVSAGAEIALLDDAGVVRTGAGKGEIVIRGAGVMAAYENHPAANATAFADGWFRTGDLGRIDDDGYLFIDGRLKEIVNRGGEKVSPREVDERLLEHPAVAQATAFAMPHPSLGEDLAAAVVLKPGAQADEGELRRFLLDHLAAFKVPSAICFVDAIPKGPTGKIQRTALHGKLGHLLARAFEAPANDDERRLAALTIDVLGPSDVERVGRHDNFFALGGDSLKGTQLIARINRELGRDLPVGLLFRHPTIAGLAEAIAAADAAGDDVLAAEIDQLSDEEVLRMLAAEEAQAAAGADATGGRRS